MEQPIEIENQTLEPLLERQKEEQHLDQCVSIIKHNIEKYLQQYNEITAETKELYDNYRSNNPELHNDLVIGLNMQSMMERTMNKNLLVLKKPYFGRIDYKEIKAEESYSLYLGKKRSSDRMSSSLSAVMVKR